MRFFVSFMLSNSSGFVNQFYNFQNLFIFYLILIILYFLFIFIRQYFLYSQYIRSYSYYDLILSLIFLNKKYKRKFLKKWIKITQNLFTKLDNRSIIYPSFLIRLFRIFFFLTNLCLVYLGIGKTICYITQKQT